MEDTVRVVLECMHINALANTDICRHALEDTGPSTIDPMDLRLYDTKTSSLQNLVPIRDGKVGIYLCGPTVQGMPHIGHLRAATSFDVLIRWLRRYGLDITYVRNVTDIDDKILAKSAGSGRSRGTESASSAGVGTMRCGSWRGSVCCLSVVFMGLSPPARRRIRCCQ